MDKNIGFIGLGTMGAPMAWNIYKTGYNLSVYNRSAEKTVRFSEAGIPVYDSPSTLAEHSEIIIIMVTDSEALKDVLLKDDGVINGLRPGATVINMSTVSISSTLGAAELVENADGQFLDVPVSGTKKPAEDGTLVILAGGGKSLITEMSSVLNAMGKQIIHCGVVGEATKMKLAINLLLGSMMQGFAEFLNFGTKQGLEINRMIETLEAGGLHAPFYAAKGALIESGNFEKNFPVNLMLKDLNLVMDASGDAGLPLPQTAATREMFSAARGAGFGDEDMAAVTKVLEKLTGREVQD